jgi:hypothetical protein
MRAMTKSAVRLAREALTVGKAALPKYASRCSRHDFTQPQLFAHLVVRQFLRTDYRGVVAWLAEWEELRRAGTAKGAALFDPLLCRTPTSSRGRKRASFAARSAPSLRARRAPVCSIAPRWRRSMPLGSRHGMSVSTFASAAG